jgi:2-dehydro-3-deoxyglucarate aldolase
MKWTSLKSRLRAGLPTIGSWLTFGHPGLAEVIASSGFEWLVIDLEHSLIELADVAAIIRAIEPLGVAPLVRLTSNDPNQAKRVMDAGAHGVLVPMVASADDARAAVNAVHYPPKGTRGVGLSRAQWYGDRFAEYVASLPEQAIVVAQIEHRDGVRALPEIVKVAGVDATIVGPYDLSASLGVPGQLDDPAVARALDEYERISKSARVPMGYHVVEPDPALITARISRGYSFLAFSVDFLFVSRSCRGAMERLRASLPRNS